jgi:hypothetical protein
LLVWRLSDLLALSTETAFRSLDRLCLLCTRSSSKAPAGDRQRVLVLGRSEQDA